MSPQFRACWDTGRSRNNNKLLKYETLPKKRCAHDALGDDDECPSEYATIFSILTFSWMSPMMKYGYKQYITEGGPMEFG
jgi:hypothetical protein